MELKLERDKIKIIPKQTQDSSIAGGIVVGGTLTEFAKVDSGNKNWKTYIRESPEMAIGVGYSDEKEPTLLCPECRDDNFIPSSAFEFINGHGGQDIFINCRHCEGKVKVKGINKVKFISAVKI